MKNIYTKDISLNVNRILAACNFDINSSSQGSFDRYYWSWKKRDFEDATLIYALMPLIKARNYVDISSFDFLCDLCARNICKNIRKNGSIDQCYPFENHPKTPLDIVSVVKCLNEINCGLESEYERLLEFTLIAEEDYAIICNHLAHHAFEYLDAFQVTDNDIFYKKAIRAINTIKEATDNEGWHLEYSGGDPGYQTRTLRYLTKCCELLRPEDQKNCLDLCKLSADFLNKLILPDGTVYEMFGSRNTSLLYPSGIEYMALHFPDQYLEMACRVRRSIEQGNAILPIHLEFDNFIRLFDDFLDAQKFYTQNLRDLAATIEKEQDFELTNFGLKKISRGNSQIYIQYKYGNALAIFKNNEVVAKDAGLLVEGQDGSFWGGRNLQNFSTTITMSNNEIEVQTPLFQSVHQELTPMKLIFLRIFNLTFLRVPFVADFFRTFIVRTLITGKKDRGKENIIFRKINVDQKSVQVTDRLSIKMKVRKIWRTVNLNLFHMASSRYHHPANDRLSVNSYEKVNLDLNHCVTKQYDL